MPKSRSMLLLRFTNRNSIGSSPLLAPVECRPTEGSRILTMAKARKLRGRPPAGTPAAAGPAAIADRLLDDVRALIDDARTLTAKAVNSALVTLYWQIGRRIRKEVLLEKRAEYGERIVETLSAQLTAEYGRGFGRRSLFRMMQFAEHFPDDQIVSALSTQLGWSHFVEILSIDDSLKRVFYAELCRAERWSTRTLRHKIGHLLYERTAISKKPDDLIARDLAALRDEDRMTTDLVFRDPYCLDFLGLTGCMPKMTWSKGYFGSWRRSSWSWGATSPSSPGKSAFPLTMNNVSHHGVENFHFLHRIRFQESDHLGELVEPADCRLLRVYLQHAFFEGLKFPSDSHVDDLDDSALPVRCHVR